MQWEGNFPAEHFGQHHDNLFTIDLSLKTSFESSEHLRCSQSLQDLH